MMFPAEPATRSEYMVDYVQQRLAEGLSAQDVLDAFHVPLNLRRPECEGCAEVLSNVLLHWIAHVQDTKLSAELVAAVRLGDEMQVRVLLDAGAPWDALDESGHSAGAHALRLQHQNCLEALVNAGSVAILAEPAVAVVGGGCLFSGENERYLKQKLSFERDRLLDADARPVMMEWEAPLMAAHADVLCPTNTTAKTVLNIGFGLGLIDTLLQERHPKTHVIVEAHPDVLEHMRHAGWLQRVGVRVLAGRWQQVLPKLINDERGPAKLFDAIFFDTFLEGVDELRRFHKLLPLLLKSGGVYSFFNGIAAHDNFLHRVYSEALRRDLCALGFDSVTYLHVPLEPPDASMWEGTSLRGRNWWLFTEYWLPIARMGSS
eukprot:CAMPEP_0119333668 /NCGR_PEP_ID=MMETSP1333-20130426/85719_1 /TAXON_ID=418940 /ORGANISM="Scyphosphaera apsteinii, Strain RCC1455" /LENGTH=374 /DNA_ID=CAMNT_0007343797 /DNA_START=90 /DNA_END=1211 /DNA_ORIENTATION=-